MNKQPERELSDGPVAVNRIDQFIVLSAEQDKKYEGMKVSEYNAWRLFGMLAVVLGVELPKNIAKAIKL